MNSTETLFYSTLGDDPDLGDLVEMFVDEIPDRIQSLEDQGSSKDWPALAVTAHQIKGAAGSYGFEQIYPYAAELEQAARSESSEDSILQSLEALVDICSRLRAGTPVS